MSALTKDQHEGSLRDSRKLPRTLCQPPGGTKSCGACCGMYNQRDESSHVALLSRLVQRTHAYLNEVDIHETSTLQDFRQRHEPAPEMKLLDGLPSCPFLGLLDADDTRLQGEEPVAYASTLRVGCMVHPFQNDGVDGRDCGVYDRFICEDYLCAAHDVMRHEEKWLVLTAVKDSYLYGLVVTDTRFVRELFERTADLNGMYPPFRVLTRLESIEAASSYFELKRDWPFRASVDGIFGQVVPLQDLDTERRPGPSESLGVEPDETESILRCLGTSVDSLEQLEQARALVQERIQAFARATELEV